MTRPRFRLVCCLCRKPAAASRDIYGLDAEWQRRFPDMVGTLACQTCALRTQWSCRQPPDDSFVDGHIRAVNHSGDVRSVRSDYDSWCHIPASGTHIGLVQMRPWSGLLQGAEEYLRHCAGRPGISSEARTRLYTTLEAWDTGADSPPPHIEWSNATGG